MGRIRGSGESRRFEPLSVARRSGEGKAAAEGGEEADRATASEQTEKARLGTGNSTVTRFNRGILRLENTTLFTTLRG